LRDPVGGVDLGGPFRELAEHAPVVELLERLALAVAARDLADEEDHRRGILHRDVEPRARIGRAGPARRHADAGSSGELAVGLGHHRHAALLPADDGLDVVAVGERVEDGEIALPWYAEDAVGAVDLE